MESPDKGMEMDAVGLSEILAKIAAGGWPSWIAAGLLGIVGILLYIFWQRKKVDLADAKTNENAGKELGGTLPANTAPQEVWTDAGKTVDQLREEARRAAQAAQAAATQPPPAPQPPQQQQQQMEPMDLKAFVERQKRKYTKNSSKPAKPSKSTKPVKPSGKKKP